MIREKKMKLVIMPFMLGAMAISSSAMAQETMYLAGYGGSFQKEMERDIIPAFEAEHNVKIVYVAGRSAETLAKLQAQKGNQEINVAIIDGGPMQQAVKFGFCDDVTDAPVYKDVYPVASTKQYDGHAVGIGLVATGITYNTESFKKNGWAAPTSWKDLTDPKFKQRFTTSPIGGTYGIYTLVMFARMNGGGENNIEPGFDAIREKLVPNVLSWTSSNNQLAQMFQNGDIDIAVWGSSRASSLKKTGFPAEFVYPEEGAPAIVISVCPVVDNSLPEKSQAFLQYLVSPEVQAKMAAWGFGPTNGLTKLDPKLAATLPFGPEKMAKMSPMDWTVINENRAEWTKVWNRTVEK